MGWNTPNTPKYPKNGVFWGKIGQITANNGKYRQIPGNGTFRTHRCGYEKYHSGTPKWHHFGVNPKRVNDGHSTSIGGDQNRTQKTTQNDQKGPKKRVKDGHFSEHLFWPYWDRPTLIPNTLYLYGTMYIQWVLMGRNNPPKQAQKEGILGYLA